MFRRWVVPCQMQAMFTKNNNKKRIDGGGCICEEETAWKEKSGIEKDQGWWWTKHHPCVSRSFSKRLKKPAYAAHTAQKVIIFCVNGSVILLLEASECGWHEHFFLLRHVFEHFSFKSAQHMWAQ